jgi:hypothetical protein
MDLIYYLDTKRWWPILEHSFKFAGVLWLLEWSTCEILCLVGKINQYASEWQQRLFECAIFYIFFKSETELVVAFQILHNKTDINNSICPLCKNGVEDEYHSQGLESLS